MEEEEIKRRVDGMYTKIFDACEMSTEYAHGRIKHIKENPEDFSPTEVESALRVLKQSWSILNPNVFDFDFISNIFGSRIGGSEAIQQDENEDTEDDDGDTWKRDIP